VIQDAFLRWSGADRSAIVAPGAWLARTVTNLCLDLLASARVRRERYVGPWLPEPVLTEDGALGPLDQAQQRESVSLAMLALLERLNPTERAVFVLREAFAYDHASIGDILGCSTANSRQLHSRARRRLEQDQLERDQPEHVQLEGDPPGTTARNHEEPAPTSAREPRREPGREPPREPVRRSAIRPGHAPRPRTPSDVSEVRRLVERFLTAAREGDLPQLETMLAADVISWSDGGGQISAARHPVVGATKVGRLFMGLARKVGTDARADVREINGEPALVVVTADDQLVVITLEIVHERIHGVRTVVNPDKLRYLRHQLTPVPSHSHELSSPS
jgi:RNA polymerase sigma-70 factor (ECF subfamily)